MASSTVSSTSITTIPMDNGELASHQSTEEMKPMIADVEPLECLLYPSEENCWAEECPKCGDENKRLRDAAWSSASDATEKEEEECEKEGSCDLPREKTKRTAEEIHSATPIKRVKLLPAGKNSSSPSSLSERLLSPSLSTLSAGTMNTHQDSVGGMSYSSYNAHFFCEDVKRSAWMYDLYLKAVERMPMSKMPSRYMGLLEMRIPLNTSKSKFIVMGLDYSRELAPFVSLENVQGKGVLLTTDEFYDLSMGTWAVAVDMHLKKPSYKHKTKTSTRVELKLSMLPGSKPCVQVELIEGRDSTGFIYLGEVSWKTLINLRTFINQYIDLLHEVRGSLAPYFNKLLNTWAYMCCKFERQDAEDIKKLIQSKKAFTKRTFTVDVNPFAKLAPFAEKQFINELLFVYPYMTAPLLEQLAESPPMSHPPS
ncbi:uncharacterized protein LOC127750345 [Frankliniella occidentalis]|uniref:Uncharacterized protein LOC127750345 n=1 Tax=Frankliniella occidentalis TaxID=133901 RepID=A0A9C6X266_FRAOC|nr:uncharacterized protein LOC127750345 [Frankliniella occidentalis]